MIVVKRLSQGMYEYYDLKRLSPSSPDQTAETKTQVTLNSAFVSLPCLGGPRLGDGYPGGRVRQIDSAGPGGTDWL